MNIALIGYGKMNREIEKLISESTVHRVVSISYKTRADGLDVMGLQRADVAIDFTSPDIVMHTIEQVSGLGVPLVIGTTGWDDHIGEVKTMIEKRKTGLLYGQNFSIGANAFFEITAYAAALLHRIEGYDVFGIETHHNGKKDSPSGTAKRLTEVLLSNYPRKKTLQTGPLQRKIRDDELHFVAVRGGRNFGQHQIVFDSASDEIRLTHQAWGRRGFAEGALLGAAFINGKKDVYHFSDVVTDIFSGKEEL